MFAPAVVGQFPGTIGQLKSAMKKVGFTHVYEVAQGADVTIKNEAKELEERLEEGQPFMTTSCCAGYNEFTKKHLPEIEQYKSDTKTPMYYTAELVKQDNPDCLTVFVGPCLAKRMEAESDPNTDYVITLFMFCQS